MTRYLYALLVGINNYPNPAHRLSGCVNDVEGWKTYLGTYAEKVGYTFKPLFLEDESATREAIITGFSDHLAQAQKGDLAVFCFAGHGSEMPGQKKFGQSPDKINQTLVCWDSRSENSWDLVDQELRHLIAKIAENEPFITLILDCCHSGSGSRPLEDRYTVRSIEPDELKRVIERPVHSYIGAPVGLSREALGLTPDSNQSVFEQKQGHHILLAACHATQTAKELRFDNASRGAFSACMQQALSEVDKPLTYEELLAQVQHRIAQHDIAEQTPQLEMIAGGSGEIRRFFLSGEPQSDGELIFALSYRDGWMVDGGRVHGWSQGKDVSEIELAIFPFVASPKDIKRGMEKIAIAHVDKVGNTFSQVRVNDGAGLSHKQLYKAVVTQLPSSDKLTVFLYGHEAGIEALRFSLDKLDAKLVPVREVSESAEAMVMIKAFDNTYEIFQGMVLPERTNVSIASRPYCPPLPTDIGKSLNQIWQWVRLRELVNTHTKGLSSRQTNFRLLENGLEIQDERWIENCELKDGRWQVPNLQLQIQNHTSVSIYCAILYLSPEFEISANLLEAGGLWVNPNSIEKTSCFAIAIPESFIGRGVVEYPVCLKLIMSSHEFNARVWEQKGLSHKKEDRELLIKEPSDFWFTKEIIVRVMMPRTLDRSPVVTERPLV